VTRERRFLILGAGYSGRAFAREKPTPETPVAGTTRSPANFGRLRRNGIAPLLFDGAAGTELLGELAAATHLVVSAAPGEEGDPVLPALADPIRRAAEGKLRWIAYLSTVGVYGDHAGAWVDETAERWPKSRRSSERVAAEDAWAALASETGLSLATLRLSGIYGPGRNAFLNLRDGTAKRLVKPGQVFNRIHAADIAGALWHLAGRNAGGVFNVTDDEPAPPQDVVAFAASLMGVEAPPPIPFATAELSPMQRSFYGENKRVANAKLKEAGYRFRFPDYRAALSAMWADGSWTGEAGDGRSAIQRG
jgi:nucleoside-diphosphate-sugar epimerase